LLGEKGVPFRIAPGILIAAVLLYGSYLSLGAPVLQRTKASNERTAASFLKRFCSAQEAIKTNDLDGNGVADYWVQDVAGMCRLVSGTGHPLDPAIAKGYWFKALPVEGTKDGRNKERFAFAAIPVRYGVTGRLTFILDQGGSMKKKDLQGREVQAYPVDPSEWGTC
jgi:hypothetical protein